MSNAGKVSQRRRGATLEEALLDSAWVELLERGYDEFTIDATAERANTSRAVLYRRWPSKQALVLAAIVQAMRNDPLVAPDTGSLRGDVIALLEQANTKRTRIATALFAHLVDCCRATDTSLAELSAMIRGGREPLLDAAIERAIIRGEIKAHPIPERILRLPIDLFRSEVLLTMTTVPKDTIEDIVDTVFLPLVGGPPTPRRTRRR